MKGPKVGDLVAVAWQDTASNDAWSGETESPSVIDCVTLGFVVSVDRHQLRLAASYARDAAYKYGERVAIPKGCIRWIRRARIGRRLR